MLEAAFPDKLRPLFEPKRFKVLWGGRGAGRSWGIARALLLIGADRPIRVLCARELQKSIDDSVHKVLSDQIGKMGLEGFYEIQRQGIYGKNGTSFSFEGIKNNPTKIKSYEGVDFCWVEEAVSVSRRSWDILIPTIRKEGSEIWLSFNPELETDYTYQHFVRDGSKLPDRYTVIHMTYSDNPFFPQTLFDEMEEMKRVDYDSYLNIWMGQCRQELEGAVYANEMRGVRLRGQVGRVPWERSVSVSTAWDLGRADKTAIWFFQRVAMQTRVLAYFEDSLQGDVGYYARELKNREYIYDTHWLPHDAFAKRLGTKFTIEEQVRDFFPSVRVRKVPNLSLTDGINAARLALPNCWFDEELCSDGLRALQHYRYKIVGYKEDGRTPIYSDKPMHDDQYDSSHGADAFRYLAIGLKSSPAGKVSVWERLKGHQESTRRERTRESEFAGRNTSLGSGWMK